MAEDVFGIVGTTQGGNFHVERVVAEGGFGVVYRAQHGAFRAPVAIKCLKVPVSMTETDRNGFLEKFRSEAELLFRLSASIPEVVRPLHVDALRLPDGRFVPFLATEWLEGESLDKTIERRRASGQAPYGLHKLVRLFRPLAIALAKAHRFPGPTGTIAIVHRDLKPENIFIAHIDGLDSIKVLDFGIAKAKSAASAVAGRQTGEDALAAFTPQYGAPEQWLPKRFGATGPWTDVWGLAITMVEALAGKPPIDGDLSAMMGTAVDEQRRPTPRNEGVVIAPEVDDVFLRALAVDPRNRTKTVDAFWTELESAMGVVASSGQIDVRREDDARPRSIPAASPSWRDALAAPSAPPAAPPAASPSRPSPVSPGPPAPRAAAGMDLELDFGASAPPAKLSAEPVRSPMAASALAPSRVPSDLQADLGGGPSGPPPSAGPSSDANPETYSSIPPAAFELDATGPSLPPRISRAPSGSFAVSSPPATSLGPAAPQSGPLALPPVPREVFGAPVAFVPVEQAAPSGPRSARPSLPSIPVPPRLREAGEQLSELGVLRRRLRLPLRLIAGALFVTIVDLIVARSTGEAISLGPIRATWASVPLALVGVGLAIWRILGAREDA